MGGWASSGWPYDGRLIVDGTPVEGQIFGDDGAITPAIRRGRAPARPGEIALGAEVMHRLGLDLDDDVVIGAVPDGPTIPGRVVGESVLASPYFVSFEPGAGARPSPRRSRRSGSRPCTSRDCCSCATSATPTRYDLQRGRGRARDGRSIRDRRPRGLDGTRRGAYRPDRARRRTARARGRGDDPRPAGIGASAAAGSRRAQRDRVLRAAGAWWR